MFDRRVLLIGLDGATWNRIDPYVRAGKLPAFKRLVQGGVSGNLESTNPPLSPPAWTSIFTGVEPKKHGIFGFVKRKEGSYFVTPISPKDRKVKALWNILTEMRRRSILVNIPFVYPPDEVNGLMITGLGTPSKQSNFTYPKEYKRKLLKNFPNYDVDFKEDLFFLSSDRDHLFEQIEVLVNEQIRVVKYLLKEEQWDFFACVIRSLDVIQHFCWNDDDRVLDCYLKINNFLNWVLDYLNKDTILFVCSDHGFSQVHTRFYVNNWLEAQGFLEMKRRKSEVLDKLIPPAEVFTKILFKFGFNKLVWKLKRSNILEFVLKHFIRSRAVGYMFEINWRHTKTYSFLGLDGTLYLNLEGREPEGIVGKDEYKELKRLITGKLLKLKDPKTGQKIIKNVHWESEVYGGKYTETPDICLIPTEGYRLMAGYNSGGILAEENKWEGDHNRNGIFITYGSEIKSNKKIKGVKVYDLAPTILAVLGLPIPRDTDGRLLKAIFEHGSDIIQQQVK